MSHSEKQKLQKARAWFKFVITGLIKPVNVDYLSEKEEQLWYVIIAARRELLADFDEVSKKLGLNVPKHRCWCGREGKYKAEYKHDGLVCYKHRKR
jgi:hypothetical protein